MADLVNGGRRETVARDVAHERRVEGEHEALGAVGPVVIGKAQAAGEQLVGGVEGKDRHLIVAVAFQEAEL